MAIAAHCWNYRLASHILNLTMPATALRPTIAGLFLCEAFDSFRGAACATRVPRWLTRIVPDVWVTVRAVERLCVPVWVVHSDGDRLFSLEMPLRIKQACGPDVN
jgi:hypothetical protein